MFPCSVSSSVFKALSSICLVAESTNQSPVCVTSRFCLISYIRHVFHLDANTNMPPYFPSRKALLEHLVLRTRVALAGHYPPDPDDSQDSADSQEFTK